MTAREEAPGSTAVDQLAFDGEATPLLLRKSTVAGLVLGFLALVVGYFSLSEWLGLSYQVDAEPFREWVDGFGLWGPVVFILALAVSVLVAPIPGAPIFVAAGLAWGPVVGTAYSMAGFMLGSSAAFWLSRRLGRRHLARLVGPRVAARLDSLADSMGGRLVFWARMLPVINFDWISFVAGMTSMRFRAFFLASITGSLLPTAVGVVAGDALGKDVRLTIAIGGVWVAGVVGSAAYFWWRRRRHGRFAAPPAANVEDSPSPMREPTTPR